LQPRKSQHTANIFEILTKEGENYGEPSDPTGKENHTIPPKGGNKPKRKFEDEPHEK